MPQGSQQRPTCLAILLCNRIIQDTQSGAYTLVDVLHSIRAASLPLHRDIAVYIEVTGLQRITALDLRVYGPQGLLVNLHQEPPPDAYTMPGVIQTIGVQFNVTFAEEGQYGIELADAEGSLAQRMFNVTLREMGLGITPAAQG